MSTASRAEVFKTMLEKAKHYFSNGSYLNAIEKVNCLIEEENSSQPFYVKLNQYAEPSSYTGFRRPNKDKIAGVLISFISKCNNEYNDKLKLNKLLFYTDFVSYKLSGYSITGLSYRAIDYGPAPSCYDNIYTYFENENIITSKWIKDINETQNTTVNFPIIADENREIAALYDMLHPNEDKNFTIRSVFIIAPDNKIKLMMSYPDSTGRNFDELLRVIDSLQLAEEYSVATPGNWKDGDNVVISLSVKDEELPAKFPKGYQKRKPYLRMTPQPNK